MNADAGESIWMQRVAEETSQAKEVVGEEQVRVAAPAPGVRPRDAVVVLRQRGERHAERAAKSDTAGAKGEPEAAHAGAAGKRIVVRAEDLGSGASLGVRDGGKRQRRDQSNDREQTT